MAVMDEFKKEREGLKNGTLKQKLSYFWDYYKWYVIIPAIIIAFVGYHIYTVITTPDTILNGIVLNTYNVEEQEESLELLDGFYEAYEVDTEEYKADLNLSLNYIANDESGTANYESMQVLMTWTAAGTIDFICADKTALTELSYKDYFVDLREVLTEEQIAKYEPYFLYMDKGVSKKQQEAFENYDYDTVIEKPDCASPELMVEPVPVMIDMSQSEKLMTFYQENPETPAFAISVNAPNLERTLEFIEYLMES